MIYWCPLPKKSSLIVSVLINTNHCCGDPQRVLRSSASLCCWYWEVTLLAQRLWWERHKRYQPYKRARNIIHMSGTRLKFESWKVGNHTQNASQNHFYCFLKDIWILKSSCSLKSPTHAYTSVHLQKAEKCPEKSHPYIYFCSLTEGRKMRWRWGCKVQHDTLPPFSSKTHR